MRQLVVLGVCGSRVWDRWVWEPRYELAVARLVT